MQFVVGNGEQFVACDESHHFYKTDRLSEAFCFKKQGSANNFVKSLPKCVSDPTFEVVLVEEVELLQSAGETLPEPEEPVPPDLNLEQFEEKIEEMELFLRQAVAQKKFLRAELQRADAELVDIQHAAEFKLLNAAEGYRLYKRLHETCVRRRQCKDALLKISYIINADSADFLKGNVSKQMRGLGNRKYAPRALPELFEEK